MSVMDGTPARRKRLTWIALAGLLAMQSFLGPVVHFLSNGFKDLSMFEMERHVTLVM